MKKLFLFLCAGLFFSVSAVFAEQKMMVNEDKEVWINHVQWEVASEAEAQAYQHPGVEVPASFRTGQPKRTGFFHYIPVQEYSEVIVWNGEKFQTIKKAGKEYGEPKLAWHIILLLAAVIFMVISNIVIRTSGESSDAAIGVVTIFTVVATLAIYFAAVTTPIVFLTATTAFAPVASLAFAFFAVFYSFLFTSNEKGYRILLTVFYISSFVAVLLWLTA